MDQRVRAVPDIDETIGGNLRRFRNLRGLTQGELGDVIGVTFQQVYKYETGETPIGAAKLLACAIILGVPVEMFYAGLDGIGADLDPQLIALLQRTAAALGAIPEPFRMQMVAIIKLMRDATAHLVPEAIAPAPCPCAPEAQP
jgi:transcriptional regulator with XRE-family HTH domain